MTSRDTAPGSARSSGGTATATRPPSLLRPSNPRHGPVAQLLMAWAPLGAILLVYWVAQWISAPLSAGAATNRLGFGLHVTGPADADRAVFGEVPTVWLQARLVEGSPHWYDVAAALVYVTHFVAIPLLTAVLWFRLRERFAVWVATVLAFTAVGVTGYVAYPAAPPWMASEQGAIGPVERISNLGWEPVHLDLVGTLVASAQDGSNPVAAMPSLHAGAAMLVALFLWPSAGPRWRLLLLVYALAMAVTLVYTGEHYVADVFAGWLTAGLAVTVVASLRASFARRLPTCRAGASGRYAQG